MLRREDPNLPESFDLLGNQGLVLPRLQNNQSLYSWCATFHRASCNIDAGTTSKQLFGNPDAAFLHDFPGKLEHFVGVTDGLLGSAETLARNRTLAGYFSPFLPAEKFERLITAMSGDRLGAIKAALGISRSGITSSLVFKACRNCMANERASLGYAYWHVQHQWPSAMICGVHQELLQSFHIDAVSCRHRHFLQPLDVPTSAWRMSDTDDQSLISLLQRLLAWSEQLVQQPELHLNEELLRWTYLLRAKQLGYIAFDGTLRLQKVHKDFHALYAGLGRISGWEFLATADGPNSGFLGGLFRQSSSLRHPCKHILVQAFLFDSSAQILSAYNDHKQIQYSGGVKALLNSLTESRQSLVKMVSQQLLSVNQASQALGVPVSQAIDYLDNEGVSRERRPRIVGSKKEERLTELLQQGLSREEIAKQLSIRTSFIKDYLSSRPELANNWKKVNLDRQRSDHRKAFLEVLSDNRGLPIKQIRRIPGNGFQWLYNNDLEWLRSVLPAIWRRS